MKLRRCLAQHGENTELKLSSKRAASPNSHWWVSICLFFDVSFSISWEVRGFEVIFLVLSACRRPRWNLSSSQACERGFSEEKWSLLNVYLFDIVLVEDRLLCIGFCFGVGSVFSQCRLWVAPWIVRVKFAQQINGIYRAFCFMPFDLLTRKYGNSSSLSVSFQSFVFRCMQRARCSRD